MKMIKEKYRAHEPMIAKSYILSLMISWEAPCIKLIDGKPTKKRLSYQRACDGDTWLGRPIIGYCTATLLPCELLFYQARSFPGYPPRRFFVMTFPLAFSSSIESAITEISDYRNSRIPNSQIRRHRCRRGLGFLLPFSGAHMC